MCFFKKIIRSHRQIPEEDKKEMEQMYDIGIPPRNIIQSLAHCVGCLDELLYLKDDMKHHLYK